MDAGSEFKGVVKKYLDDKNVSVRVAIPGRKKQQAFVENRNGQIGKELFKYMNSDELVDGKTSRVWVQHLPDVITFINKRTIANINRKPKRDPSDQVLCSGDACNLLNIGDNVRVKLDYPIDIVTKKKLHGSFRAGDIRWNPKIQKISDILLFPNQVPLYVVDDNKNINYTKAELQIVNPNEIKPKSSKVKK